MARNVKDFPLLSDVPMFRTGDYGDKGRYVAADLQAMAKRYDPSWLEAPVTPDHVQTGPAWGWVERIYAKGDTLYGDFRMHPDAHKQMEEGMYRRRSVEIYRKFALKDGSDGPYIKACSVLGAATPHVKGMPDVQFSENGTAPWDSFDFAAGEADDQNSTKEENRMTGKEAGSALLAGFTEEQLTQMQADLKSTKDALAEKEKELSTLATDKADLVTKYDGLKKDFSNSTARIIAIEEDRAREKEQKRFTDVAEEVGDEGRFTPRELELLEKVFHALPADSDKAAEVAFADDEGKDRKVAPRALFLEFMQKAAAVVPVGESLLSDNGDYASRALSASDDPVGFSKKLNDLAEKLEKEKFSESFGECLAEAERRLKKNK